MIFKEIEKDLKELKLRLIINRWKPGSITILKMNLMNHSSQEEKYLGRQTERTKNQYKLQLTVTTW